MMELIKCSVQLCKQYYPELLCCYIISNSGQVVKAWKAAALKGAAACVFFRTLKNCNYNNKIERGISSWLGFLSVTDVYFSRTTFL